MTHRAAYRYRLLATAIAVAAGGVAALPGAAHAAACPNDLTVAGVKVTGEDCEAQGAEFLIRNPRFGATGAQRITGLAGLPKRMRLNSSRTEMTPEQETDKLQLSVGGQVVFIGPIKVGKFELCDVEPASAEPPAALGDAPAGENPDLSGADERVEGEDGSTSATLFVPRGVGCRQLPAFKLDFSTFEALGKIAGLDLGKFSAKVPTVAGFDDEKGGRVFMAAPLKLPPVFDTEISENGQKKKVPTFVALGVELSVNEGLKPFSGGFRLNRPIPLGIPGLALEQLSGVADLINDRFGGGFALRLPGGKFLGANVAFRNGDLEALGGDVVLPVPVPLFGGAITVTSIGGTFQGEKTDIGPNGSKTTTPRSVQGRARFFVGPAAGGGNPFQGDMSLTLAGPTVKLAGQLFAVIAEKQVKLGDARVLVSIKPVRFEAEANATLFEIIKAHAFFGIVPEHFTALGEASINVPEDIKFIGGQRIGGFSLALSDIGAGAVITLDPPLVKPFTVGLGTGFKPFKFKRIDSVSQFITVKPSAAGAAGSGRAVALTAAQRTVRLPKSSGDLIVTVTGATRRPRAVRLSMGGKRLRSVSVGSDSRSVQVGLARPPAGRLTVSSRDRIARIDVGRVREFPYLDPKPGFGTRAQGPVTAGQPVRVCWRVKHAPRGTAVDLFEDQNGNLGTGRSIATGLGGNACFDVPTAGLEPGRHWVYGVVRVGSQPVSQRYWPIPITVVDPTALPAPGGVVVAPTLDGAAVGWQPVSGAGSYVIRAEPVDDNDAEPLEYDAPATALSALLSLRGAATWRVTVQAVRSGGGRGNASAPQIVQPTDPVVVSGRPNGVAEVGKLWAFELEIFGGVQLRLVSGPRGMRLRPGTTQLRWTPSRSAGASEPAEFTIEGCKDGRCVTRSFHISAYARGYAPPGPARGFQVTPNVVKAGKRTLVTIRAQGIDQRPLVKIDGKRVRGVRRLNAGAIEFRSPKLRRGAHGVSLKIGGDAEERKPGALVGV